MDQTLKMLIGLQFTFVQLSLMGRPPGLSVQSPRWLFLSVSLKCYSYVELFLRVDVVSSIRRQWYSVESVCFSFGCKAKRSIGCCHLLVKVGGQQTGSESNAT